MPNFNIHPEALATLAKPSDASGTSGCPRSGLRRSSRGTGLPREAVEAYLADELVRAVSREVGGMGGGAWAMEAGAYGV